MHQRILQRSAKRSGQSGCGFHWPSLAKMRTQELRIHHPKEQSHVSINLGSQSGWLLSGLSTRPAQMRRWPSTGLPAGAVTMVMPCFRWQHGSIIRHSTDSRWFARALSGPCACCDGVQGGGGDPHPFGRLAFFCPSRPTSQFC